MADRRPAVVYRLRRAGPERANPRRTAGLSLAALPPDTTGRRRAFDDSASRAGAAAWVGRVDEELARAAGARAGQDLSVGERTVAELAAAGVTNREIGARLYLSPKTIETVLTRVYRKLGVRSRTELARRLEAG